MSWLDRRLPYLSSTMAWIVGLGLLTTPVGPTEVMMIVRLGPPRPPGLLLPDPLRLLTRLQLPRSDVNVVAGAGRWSAPPLQERSSNRKRKDEAGGAWFLAGEEKPGMRTGYPARRPNQPNTFRPLSLYLEGPSLPARLAVSVIVLCVGLYLDRVIAGGKAPG